MAHHADVLLVDSQNLLSRAGADHRRGCHLPGDSLAAAFADWLQFLAAGAEPQLLVAVFDTPISKRSKQQQPPQREQVAPEYLQRRKRRQQQPVSGTADIPEPGSAGMQLPPRPPAGDPLRPFKQQVERLGGVCLEATGGWEADDGVAAACQTVLRRHPEATLLVASGDKDMQQLLAPQVSWLQLHNQTSAECPLGVELVAHAAFEQHYGFPPSAYADWLAFTGKQEASIRGADVGARTAAKLLARYRNLEAVLVASAAGQLKGWGPAVQQLLAGSSTSSSSSGAEGSSSSSSDADRQRAAHLRRNRQLFAVNPDPSVVQPRGMRQLLQALDHLQPAAAGAASWHSGTSSSSCSGSSSSSCDFEQTAASSSGEADQAPASSSCDSCGIEPTPELAWRHPLHARRWRHLQQLAAAGGHSGGPPQQLLTPQGLAVDELWQLPGSSSPSSAGSSDGSGSTSGGATFHVCPCDVTAGSWGRVAELAGGNAAGADHTRVLMPLLHGAMRHHVKLVQRAGFQIKLTPCSMP